MTQQSMSDIQTPLAPLEKETEELIHQYVEDTANSLVIEMEKHRSSTE